MMVPMMVNERLARDLDPVGVQERKAHPLKRRNLPEYWPSHFWHYDGYDKFKPYGFPIHGYMDGWSEKNHVAICGTFKNLPSNQQHIICKQLKSKKAV